MSLPKGAGACSRGADCWGAALGGAIEGTVKAGVDALSDDCVVENEGIVVRASAEGAGPDVDKALSVGLLLKAAIIEDGDIVRESAIGGAIGKEDAAWNEEVATAAAPPAGIIIAAGEEAPTGINMEAAAMAWLAPAANCGEKVTAPAEAGLSGGCLSPPHCWSAGQRGSSHNKVGCKTSVDNSEELSQ